MIIKKKKKKYFKTIQNNLMHVKHDRGKIEFLFFDFKQKKKMKKKKRKTCRIYDYQCFKTLIKQ